MQELYADFTETEICKYTKYEISLMYCISICTPGTRRDDNNLIWDLTDNMISPAQPAAVNHLHAPSLDSCQLCAHPCSDIKD